MKQPEEATDLVDEFFARVAQKQERAKKMQAKNKKKVEMSRVPSSPVYRPHPRTQNITATLPETPVSKPVVSVSPEEEVDWKFYLAVVNGEVAEDDNLADVVDDYTADDHFNDVGLKELVELMS